MKRLFLLFSCLLALVGVLPAQQGPPGLSRGAADNLYLSKDPGRSIVYSRWLGMQGAGSSNGSTQTGTSWVHTYPSSSFRDLQIVLTNVIGAGANGGANGGFQAESATVNSLTVSATVSVPIAVFKVASATQSTVTLTDLYGNSPTLPLGYTGCYLLTPYSTVVNHTRKQIGAVSGSTVTLSATYADGTNVPATGSEVIIYSQGRDIKFGGSLTGTIPSKSYLISDVCPGLYDVLSVPLSRGVYGPMIGVYADAGSGGIYQQLYPMDGLDGCYAGQDRRNSLAILLGSATNGGPSLAAVIGKPSKPLRGNILLLGDSITAGINYPVPQRKSALQIAAERLGYGVLNLAVPGETAQAALSNCTVRLGIADALGIKECWLGYGTNDLRQGGTNVALKINIAAIRALRPGWRWRIASLPPAATSTDGWITLANQTVASWEAQRLLFNADVRSGLNGFFSCIDVGSIYDAPTAIGKWRPFGTVDGLHPEGWIIQEAATALPGLSSVVPTATGYAYAL